MKRSETYATSGPRMWCGSSAATISTRPTFSRAPAVAGYEKGVPMGGDLPAAPAGKAPTFLVAALKDPTSGNLDRIQIIKGWVDKAGKTQEKIFDVVWGDAAAAQDRRDGKLTPVGNTVDVAAPHGPTRSATPELMACGRTPSSTRRARLLLRARAGDPDAALDRLRRRVLQGEDGPNVPMTTQERAFTSPIWYTP